MNVLLYPKLLLAISFSLMILSPGGNLQAQAPPILWQRCYGGDSTDYISCIKQTSDGGYIAAGGTRSVTGDLASNSGVKGLWVLKLDPFGNIQWEKTYNDTLFGGSYIEPTYDGGYILTGNHTIKLHSDGSIAWLDNLEGSTVHQISDSGYILSNPNGSIVGAGLTKLNAGGSIVWQSLVNTMGAYFINDACQSFTTGYLITGSDMDIYHSPFTTTTDDMGNILIPVVEDLGHGGGMLLCKTNDGKYINLSGDIAANVISKINDDCTADWYNGLYGNFIIGIASTSDSGALGCGGTQFAEGDNSSGSDIAVIKYTSAGALDWDKTMGGTQEDLGSSVFQAANGNYVVAGYTYSNDGDVSGNHGGQDGWVVEFGSNVGIPIVANNMVEVQAYPIPALDVVNIALPQGYENATLKLVDVSGKVTPVAEDNNGLSRVLHLNGLAAGEYLLEVINDGQYNTKKIIHY